LNAKKTTAHLQKPLGLLHAKNPPSTQTPSSQACRIMFPMTPGEEEDLGWVGTWTNCHLRQLAVVGIFGRYTKVVNGQEMECFAPGAAVKVYN
jgi:hypothetical protein